MLMRLPACPPAGSASAPCTTNVVVGTLTHGDQVIVYVIPSTSYPAGYAPPTSGACCACRGVARLADFGLSSTDDTLALAHC